MLARARRPKRERQLENPAYSPIKAPVVCALCHQTKEPTNNCACPPAAPQAVVPLQGHQKSSRQKWLTRLGWFLALFIAIGTGVSTTAAFITLNIVTGGLVTYLGAALIFSAGFTMNLLINKNAVPDVLIDILGKEKPFGGLMVYEDGEALSPERKVAMGFGIFLALCVGFTNGVLIYSSTLSLSTAFTFLAGAGAIFPPIAAVLGFVTLICLSAVMLKNIAKLIQTKNIREKCWNFLDELTSIDEKWEHNKNKSLTQRKLERFGRLFFTLIAIPLGTLGLVMTMNASAAGAKVFLLRNIPHASVLGVQIASKVITLVFALLGRIPFTFLNIFKTVAKIFPYSHKKGKEAIPLQPFEQPSQGALVWYYTQVVVLYSLAFVNAFGNALISVVGGGGIPSGGGGFINSFAAGVSNIQVNSPTKKLSQQTESEAELMMSAGGRGLHLVEKDSPPSESYYPYNENSHYMFSSSDPLRRKVPRDDSSLDPGIELTNFGIPSPSSPSSLGSSSPS